MIDYTLLIAVIIGVTVLLLLILVVRLQAFLALLISSVVVGLTAGMEPAVIIKTMQEGMAGTLGFVAMVVGLGAMFGAILESSGGAEILAKFLLEKFGETNASWALMLAGFIVAIPVFFDVGFIILVPLVYAMQVKTGKSLLLYAIPLLAGLATTHAFIPPTPGPVAVADILDADLGWVILFGAIAGFPAAIVSGPLFAKYIAGKININAPEYSKANIELKNSPSARIVFFIIGIPIFLIVSNSLLNSPLFNETSLPVFIGEFLKMSGHPFSALIIANLAAWYILGIRKGISSEKLLEISTKSLAPAGIIILLTGAGGVFKQMLINTGAGEMLAKYFADSGLTLVIFAFVTAGLIRILQGSATVAMIAAAGMCAPLLSADIAEWNKALLVISIAAGASMISHVNDSGFWLVSKYLGLTEKQTFASWTIMTTLLAFTGFLVIVFISFLF